MKSVVALGCAAAPLSIPQVVYSQERSAANASGKKNPPTEAEAQKFLDAAESRYFDLTNKAQRATWVEENFITEDTEEIAAESTQELSAFAAEISKKAHDFDGVTPPPLMARKMLLLNLSTEFPSPAFPKEQKGLERELASFARGRASS